MVDLSPRQASLLRWLGRWALRAIGPALLAILLVRVVDYGELGEIVGDLELPWVLAAVLLWQITIVLRTLRWMELHHAFGLRRAPFFYQLRLTYAISFATLMLPQIINPLSRFVLLLQDGYRAQRAAIGAVLEKVLELVAFVGFGLYGSIFLASTFGALVWWLLGAAVLALAAGVALYAARFHVGRVAKALISRLPGVGQGAVASAEGLLREMLSLRIHVAARLCLWSLLIALAQATTLYFLSRSLGVGLSYPFMLAAWGVVALTMLLPISVNGLGTRESVLVVAFHAADKSTDAAVALGLLAVVVAAVSSSPGVLEWLRRFFVGSGSGPAAEPGQTAPVASPTVHPQGERGQ